MPLKSPPQSPGTLADALARARELRPKLTAFTEELNHQLAEAESAIADLNLGVRASVELFAGRQDHGCDLLTFGKLGGKWALYVESGGEGSDDNELIPIRSMPRDVRMVIPQFLVPLMMEMVRVVANEIDLVDDSAITTRRFIAEIRGPTEDVIGDHLISEQAKAHATSGDDGVEPVETMPVPPPLEDGNGNLTMPSPDWRKFAQATEEQEKQGIRTSLKKLQAAKGKVAK